MEPLLRLLAVLCLRLTRFTDTSASSVRAVMSVGGTYAASVRRVLSQRGGVWLKYPPFLQELIVARQLTLVLFRGEREGLNRTRIHNQLARSECTTLH